MRQSTAAPGHIVDIVDIVARADGTTALQYTLVVEALNFKFRTLRSAIGS